MKLFSIDGWVLIDYTCVTSLPFAETKNKQNLGRISFFFNSRALSNGRDDEVSKQRQGLSQVIFSIWYPKSKKVS